jgi:glucose/arabinose dehydrogenase
LQEEDCVAMRSALHIVNGQLATLADHQQQQQQQQVYDSNPHAPHTSEQQQQQQQQQEELIARQKHELAKQQQELAATAQQLQEVCSLLALKNDSLSHLTRHSSMLETQVRQQGQRCCCTAFRKSDELSKFKPTCTGCVGVLRVYAARLPTVCQTFTFLCLLHACCCS